MDPLELAKQLDAAGNALKAAAVAVGASLPTIPIPPVTGITDRTVRPKPTPLALGPAGSHWTEPTFGTKITRVTDVTMNGGAAIFTPSYIGGAWNADGSMFTLKGNGGNAIFYKWDGLKATLLPITIVNQFEPWWSYVDPHIIYYNSARSYRQVMKFNVTTGVETLVADMDALYPGHGMVPGGYIGALVFKDADVWAMLFGGYNQDTHWLIHHSVYGLIDYRTLDVQTATGHVKGNTLHSFGMDRTGQLFLSPTGADIAASGYSIAQMQFYNPATKTLTPVTPTMKGGGHYSLGYNQMINMENPDEWLKRPLDNLSLFTPIITPPMTTGVWGLDDHSDWRNAIFGQQSPVLSVTIRKDQPIAGVSGGPWQVWDDEVILIHTDGSGTVQRLAHHQAIYDPATYQSQPEGHIDPTGKYVFFASNWGGTIGFGRSDVFMVTL